LIKSELRITKFLILFLCGAPLFSQITPPDTGNRLGLNTSSLLAPYLASAPEITSQAALLIDAETGTVLYAKNPNEEIPPASLTKLMTMHLVLQEVDAGRASLDEIVPIGVESWALRQPPRSSLMFLAPGQTVTLREIMLGLAIPSGNDAAVAAALRVAPTVDEFAAMMTAEARRMGLTGTRFIEPSGISEHNFTTAAEFAAFCREYLRLHPQALAEFHSVPEFAYPKASNVAEAFRDRPNTIVQVNRNTLLKTFPGVDGLKTGYIDEAGYNIALTAERNNTRLIAVILGAPAHSGGDRIRDRDGEQLLSWAFEHFKTVRPAIDPPESARLWKGKDKWAHLRIDDAGSLNSAGFPNLISFTAPSDRARINSLRLSTEVDSPLIAPLPAHFPVGWQIISDEKGELYRVRLLTAQEYQQGNVLKRLWDSIRLFFMK
jgi:D-alanyl-D-alanine carboxypeptidase (penicillin-binding protein 5/6)